MLAKPLGTKSACNVNSADRRECEGIMRTIYQENPTFFPHGLFIEGLDDAYVVKQASTLKPVGFTGWQEFPEGRQKVGYYSIGILPEFRGQGYAKSALAGILAEKEASVDKVRAFIVPHNLPSIRLAESFGIEITHNG
jgi:RimJ/RimL family protein N-acetyltransferase